MTAQTYNPSTLQDKGRSITRSLVNPLTCEILPVHANLSILFLGPYNSATIILV